MTFVVCASALVLQTYLVLVGTPVLADVEVPPLDVRVARLVSYFTIQSNVLVAVVTALLTADPARDGRLFRVLRLAMVVAIAVTALVHYVALRPLLHLTGGSWWADLGLHVVVPLLALTGWLAFGPRPRIDLPTAAWALLWPLLWL
ncbi:Pr6Pr family membrane protein, partial [Streptobacillus moniliformis]|uniref:Pr6Pr family membrane protein n=1 Tax=Streptobacillus moniliformis TaxID=34105 RepID=UPI0018C8A26D